MCGSPLEDIKHFILNCTGYEKERRQCPSLQQPYREDEESIIGELLFDNRNIEKSKEVLNSFWMKREEKVKNIN